MGNSHSSTEKPHRVVESRQSLPSKLKTKLSRISLRLCRSGAALSSSSACSSDIHEKCIDIRDQSTLAESPTPSPLRADHDLFYDHAYSDFLEAYPEYQQTWIIDSLRRSEFSRLHRFGETYVDYMGGSLYPESLVRSHSDFLTRNIMGNTHSVSNSSQLSTSCAAEARASVLQFFDAPTGYSVVFTPNASAALKLVGESYPFRPSGALVLGVDSHNSLNGLRRFAAQGGARVCYLPSGPHGGIDIPETENTLAENQPDTLGISPCLFALTGQSNISNTKNPLNVARYAKSLGYHTLLDAAALAPTSQISLKDNPVDAMAVSFYKMFGFPTGIGALVVKDSFLRELSRPWFAGGTVDVVQVPGSIVTMTHEVREQFEDGTINYLMLPAITYGLRFLTAYMPFLPIRLSSLTHYLASQLSRLQHDVNGTPVVRVLSQPPSRVTQFGHQADTGSTVSLIFLGPDGVMLPNSFIEYSASRQKISLRTGCVCNPGGAAAILGIEDDMNLLVPGVTLRDFERTVGRELGVVRISLGLASSFEDVHRVLRFARLVGSEASRRELLTEWAVLRPSLNEPC